MSYHQNCNVQNVLGTLTKSHDRERSVEEDSRVAIATRKRKHDELLSGTMDLTRPLGLTKVRTSYYPLVFRKKKLSTEKLHLSLRLSPQGPPGVGQRCCTPSHAHTQTHTTEHDTRQTDSWIMCEHRAFPEGRTNSRRRHSSHQYCSDQALPCCGQRRSGGP